MFAPPSPARERLALSELYLANYTLPEYLDYLRHHHPQMFDLLSEERCRTAEAQITYMNSRSWEFEDERAGGRGAAYNLAQDSVSNRHVGMATLLKCCAPSFEMPDRNVRILDVLGGNGPVARFCRTLAGPSPTIYTADISKFMIDACHAQALPCIRQSATNSLFRDAVLDAVLIAYGSHHLDGDDRTLAAREAHRTLKAGGRLVLHDFEIGGRVSAWFERVVHPYSRTGHPHEHYSRREMFDLLTAAGFRDVRVFDMADPFTLNGRTPGDARRKAIMHLYAMYDLVKVGDTAADVASVLERLIADTLGPITIRHDNDGVVAHIPRDALVAVGVK